MWTRLQRLVGAPLLVALVAGGGVVAPRPAHAQLVGCQTDPVLLLSNGAELDLRASIDDAAGDVSRVVFTIHAPAGVRIVTYTTGALGPKEVVRFAADQPWGRYVLTTLVETGLKNRSVTATGQALTLGGAALAWVSGLSGRPLSITLDL